MRLVSLTTDFGLKDAGVASLKAAVLTVNPQVSFVDVSHLVRPFAIDEAAHLLSSALSFFPPGSIHLSLVHHHRSPFDRLLVVRSEAQWLIAPDNGLIHIVLNGLEPESWGLVAIENGSLGKALFSDCARLVGLISNPVGGFITEAPGNRDRAYETAQTLRPAPEAEGRSIAGHVVYIDHYGNLITNIHRDLVESMRKGREIRIELPRNHRIAKISAAYGEAGEGKLIALFNGLGYLEIALGRSSGVDENGAGRLLGISLRDRVELHFVGLSFDQ